MTKRYIGKDMLEYITENHRKEMRMFESVLNDYHNGVITADDSLTSIYTFMENHGVILDMGDIDISTMFSRYCGNGYSIMRFCTINNRRTVTIMFEMWKFEICAMFIGSSSNPFEHRCIVTDNPASMFYMRCDEMLFDFEREALNRISSGKHTRLELDFKNTTYESSNYWVYVRNTDIGPDICASIVRDLNDTIEAAILIPKNIECIVVNRYYDISTENFWLIRYIDGKIRQRLTVGEYAEIFKLKCELEESDEWVDLVAGLTSRVSKRLRGANTSIPTFVEPDTVSPVFEKITATDYTKKRLSTV